MLTQRPVHFTPEEESAVLSVSYEVIKWDIFIGKLGVESNWIHSALRPSIGLLCQPRVIMMMEKLVEWWVERETEVLEENMPQSRFVHHKPLIPARTWTRASAGRSRRLTAWDTARPIKLDNMTRDCGRTQLNKILCSYIRILYSVITGYRFIK
jgi:hypothetical protein